MVTESAGPELGAGEVRVGAPAARLAGLLGPAVLGEVGAGGSLAVAIASRIQSRSLVTRA